MEIDVLVKGVVFMDWFVEKFYCWYLISYFVVVLMMFYVWFLWGCEVMGYDIELL